MKKPIVVVYGTRPEAIKLAPVILALRDHEELEPYIVLTGQHRSMLDQVNEVFGITGNDDLDVLQPGQSLTEITTRVLNGVGAILDERIPAAVLVQGDTTSSFAAALAAFYRTIPVIHLEAGLRTFNRLSPFPEEANRCMTAQLASLHLAPTPAAKQNLLSAGIKPDEVVCTGNTVIDALDWSLRRPAAQWPPGLESLDGGRKVILVTAHRRESWDSGLHNVGRALAELAQSDPELLIVFPIHRNPIVRESIEPSVAGLPNVILLEPLSYGAFTQVLARADVVLTDSGGIQEEAPSLGKPVLVMRDNTERPEGVEAGTAKLVGTDPARIVAEVRRLLDDPAAYAAMSRAVNPYGDGRAAERSVAAISAALCGTQQPEEFTMAAATSVVTR